MKTASIPVKKEQQAPQARQVTEVSSGSITKSFDPEIDRGFLAAIAFDLVLDSLPLVQ